MKNKIVDLFLRITYNYIRPLWNRFGLKVVGGKRVYFWRKNLDIMIWERWNEQDKVWEFNHFDYYKLDVDIPPSDWPDQIKNWKKAKWRKVYATLRNGVVIKAPIA